MNNGVWKWTSQRQSQPSLSSISYFADPFLNGLKERSRKMPITLRELQKKLSELTEDELDQKARIHLENMEDGEVKSVESAFVEFDKEEDGWRFSVLGQDEPDLRLVGGEFESGEKVVWRGETYDFGYMGQTGKAIIYEEGECNMQDSLAVDPDELKRKSE